MSSVLRHNKANATISFAEAATEQVEEALELLFDDPILSEDEQKRRAAAVRFALVATAKVIIDNVPTGADRQMALKKLREIRHDCNEALLTGGGF